MKAALFIAAVLALGACGSDTDEVVDVALGDLACEMTNAGSWESAPLPPASETCSWLRFEGKTSYEIEHGLGAAPVLLFGYIAFDPSGVGASLAVGDTLVVLAADDTSVLIRNRTNQDFFLRLVLE